MFAGRGRRLNGDSPPTEGGTAVVDRATSTAMPAPMTIPASWRQSLAAAAPTPGGSTAAAIEPPRPAYFDTLLGAGPSSHIDLDGSQDTQPANLGVIEFETIMSEMGDFTDKINARPEKMLLWSELITQHRYSAPVEVKVHKLIKRSHDLLKTITPFMNEALEGGTYNEAVYLDVKNFTIDITKEFDNLEEEIKPFLPRDQNLAIQLRGLRDLVEPDGPMAKRLRQL